MGKGKFRPPNNEIFSLFRAMSHDEYRSINENGNRFIDYDFAMSTKWFAVHLEDAHRWAALFYPNDNYVIIEIIVPREALSLMHHNPHLDMIGPAYAAEIDLLNMVMKSLRRIYG